MVEEIKKDIEEQSYNENFCTKIIQLDDLFKILDKYDNQPDYKSAFEELVNDISNPSIYSSLDINGEIIIRTYENLTGTVQDIEQKYNLGGE